MLKAGNLNKGMFANCRGIHGRTLGLIGFGNISKNVCRAAKAFGMDVIVSTRTEHAGLEEEMGFSYVCQDELLARSDIVSIHTSSNQETVGMVNEDFLRKMKTDAMLINTSHSNLVNEDALFAKLEACPDFWVGTDVYNGEPSAEACEFKHPISQHRRVYGTHNCGASTQQAEAAIGQEAVRVIQKYNKEGVVDKFNWVNAASTTDTTMSKI